MSLANFFAALTLDPVKKAAHYLQQAGCPHPVRRAALLWETARANAAVFWPLIEAHAAGAPLSRLTGVREFWSLPLQLNEATLDPRADSETIIEAVLQAQTNRQHTYRILDLGTGSGALLLALLSEYPNASGVGVDVSEAACQQAQRNAVTLGLATRALFITSYWAAALHGGFDIIVSNPPYIEADDISLLDNTVTRYDPLLALDGGEDGLTHYRTLATQVPSLLTHDGVAVFEVGYNQCERVKTLLQQAGLVFIASQRDLAGIERALLFKAQKGLGKNNPTG